MKLYIAEKPSVAKVIAEELGVAKRCTGYINCKNGDIVTNCYGHMLELAEPDAYLPDTVPLNKNKAKVWRLQDLPIIPKKWLKAELADCKNQLKVIKELLSRLKPDDAVVNAGDPDREGQLLVDEVLNHFAYKGSVLRYWSSAMDKVSVQRALEKLEDNDKYALWGTAAEARARADWLIGMNLTRLITLRNHTPKVLSVGRVQTPVLQLVVERDAQINNFKSKKYFNLEVTFSHLNGDYVGKWQIPEDLLSPDGYLLDKNIVADKIAALQGKTGEIASFTQQVKRKSPPLPFTLSTMQQLCSRKFKFSAKKTLDILQSLYEKKLTTYPRSSCPYLPESQKADVAKILEHLKVTFPQLQSYIAACKPQRQSSVWNDKAVNEEAHTGIVPTLCGITPDGFKALKPEEQQVYELVARQYIGCFLSDYAYQENKIVTKVGTDVFNTTLNVVLNQGWKGFNKEEDDKDAQDKASAAKVPAVSKGDLVRVKSAEEKSADTKPPQPFTEGTLIKAMENIAAYVTDPAEKKILKDDDGIGTAATRADIISKLKTRDYIEEVKGKLHSTETGRQLVTIVPQKLLSASLTAQAEKELKKIQKGDGQLSVFMQEEEQFLKDLMTEAQNMSSAVLEGEKCPKCGSKLWRRESKFKQGQFYWFCENQDCSARFVDANGKPGAEIIVISADCPCCGQKNAVRRFESKKKPGTFFWHCSNEQCGAYFQDNHGKLGEKEEKAAAVKCPSCGKELLRRYESKKKPGAYYWFCSGCKAHFADDHGKPGDKQEFAKLQEAKCPKCGKTAKRLANKNDPAKFHWYCWDCKTSFKDQDGKIGEAFS